MGRPGDRGFLAGVRSGGGWGAGDGLVDLELFARLDGEIGGAQVFAEGSANFNEWSAIAGLEWRF